MSAAKSLPSNCKCVARSSEAWPWGAYMPEPKAAPARAAVGGKRARAVTAPKPGVKRGHGAIESAPPARGRGRAPKRRALTAISEEESPAKRRPRLAAGDSGHTAAEGGRSPQKSSEGGNMVYVDDAMSSHSDGGDVDEDGDAAAPEPHWRHRPSAAERSRIVLDDEEDADDAGAGTQPAEPQDLGDTAAQLPSAPAAAPKPDSLLGRLLSPSLSMTQSLPTGSQHSDGVPLSPAQRLYAPPAEQLDHPGAAQNAQTAQQRTTPGDDAGSQIPTIDGAATMQTPPRPQMSLRQRLAELKAMRARNAGAA